MRNIIVPELGESVVEARVARWLKKEGDHVEVGEPIVELETEKIDLEVNAERGGIVASIKRKEGDDVKIGEVLAVVDDSAGGRVAGADRGPAAATPSTALSAEAAVATDDTRATPAARRMAEDHDVELGALQGSGTAGRVMKDPLAPSERSEERRRMSKRRATIARRLVEAQHTAAILTTFNEIDMTAVMSLRQRQKEAFTQQHGVGLGVVSFFVKAAIAALRAFPQLNAEIQGDEIVFKRYYDIGVAVGAKGGLVVPVLRDADRMSFSEIERAIREFAKRADEGTLALKDLAGGTFTITNGGVFGSLLSTPILNPPQVGILGLHKIQERPIALNGQVLVRAMMYVALSYDHRIVDGREAVQFLVKVKEFIEDPGHLLLES